MVSLLVLAPTIPAFYVFHLAGAWRRIYVIGSVRDASCGDVDFYRAWGLRDQAISRSTGCALFSSEVWTNMLRELLAHRLHFIPLES